MAGGRGERLWPKSRTRLPKQFLSLGPGPSFLQQAYHRLAGMPGAPTVVVLTSADTRDLVCDQLPLLPETHLLAEPVARDTAATAALGAAMALALGGDNAVLALVPADHAVFDVDRFRLALDSAWTLAERERCPVLVGIPPTRPETGYGYILRGNPLPAGGPLPLAVVERFVEKPDVVRAAEYLASGRYLWNSGICVCRADVLLAALGMHLPGLRSLLRALDECSPTTLAPGALLTHMRDLSPISLDYAVLEKLERALVVEVPLAWDDVGNWEALTRLYPTDGSGNVRVGSAVLSETERTVVYSSASGRLVVTHGVSDLVVVDTDDCVLVAERGALPGLKQALHTVRASGYAAHLDEPQGPAVRPVDWGHEVEVPGHDMRLLCLQSGADVPSDSLEGRTVRLLSGDAEVRFPAGAGNPLTEGRECTIPSATRVVSATGCVLALGSRPVPTAPVAAAADASPMYGSIRRIVAKPWGREIWWAMAPSYAAKRLEVRAGHALSLQYHERKHETLYFLEGVVRLRLGTGERTVTVGDVAVIPPGTIHRMEALTDAIVFEVSTPDLDDVVRLEDRYGRISAAQPTL